MWTAVEVREVRTFLVLAEELHFGRTAARVGLTQSRVSQTIRALERKLGVQLAHRTSRRVALTPAGEQFRDQAAAVLRGLDDVLRATWERGRRLAEPIRLGVTSAAAVDARLSAIIAEFEDAYPEGGVEFVGLPFADRFAPLRAGEVDLMVTHLPLDQPDLVVGPRLAREPYLLAVARDHPLADRDQVTTEDLADHPIGELDLSVPPELRAAIEPRKTPSGRPIQRTKMRVREASELILAVALGRIIQPVTATFARAVRHPNVVFVPFGDLPPATSVLVKRRGNRHPAVPEFLRIARVSTRGPDQNR